MSFHQIKDKLRILLWNILGVSKTHLDAIADVHFLFEDKYTIWGRASYNNHAQIYRWSEAPLTIGKYCSISYGVKFIMDDGRHCYNQVTNYPFQANDIGKKRGITIGNDVWIGLDAIILNGITIGNGVTIAAGSVVTHDVPDYCIVAGVPAKIIKLKCTQKEAARMNEIAWWDWNEEQINASLSDFRLPIPEFISKHS